MKLLSFILIANLTFIATSFADETITFEESEADIVVGSPQGHTRTVNQACSVANPEHRDSCASVCGNSDSPEALAACADQFRPDRMQVVEFDESPEDTIVVDLNALRRRTVGQACASVPESNRRNCTRGCASFSSPSSLRRCAQRYTISYTWVDDAENRKIISSSAACGGRKICIGNVRYTNAEGQEETRLAVCGSENCGDDDASACAAQGGYGSKTFSEYQESRTARQSSQRPSGASRGSEQ